MLIRAIDLETTGTEPTDAVVEVGCIDLLAEPLSINTASSYETLVNPERPIPPEASAVHHIVDEDVADAPLWPPIRQTVMGAGPAVFAAHKADFEQQWLAAAAGDRPWICTYKCAHRLWPDAPRHSNQTLRYWLRPEGLDRQIASVAHRAFPDAYVTAFLLREMLKLVPIEQLLEWSREIAMPATVNFGQHRGALWANLPIDYLEWIIGDKNQLDADTKALAGIHLRKRLQPPGLDAYIAVADMAIKKTINVAELEDWWRGEAANRESFGLRAGTPAFDKLVEACAQQKKLLLAV